MSSTNQITPALYERLLSVAEKITAETDIRKLCSLLIEEAQNITNAEAGTLYLVGQDDAGIDTHLDFVIIRNNKLDLGQDLKISPPPISLYTDDGEPNRNNVACYAYHEHAKVNIEDAYNTDRFDFAGTRQFDHATGYRSKSFLTVPLLSDTRRVLGVFQLINQLGETGNIGAFSTQNENTVEILARFAAKALEAQLSDQRRHQLLVRLSSFTDTQKLAEQILREARAVANADGGMLFLINDRKEEPVLEYALVLNELLDIQLGGANGEPLDLEPLPLDLPDGNENLNNLVTACALTGTTFNIPDTGLENRFDFASTELFDRNGYRSISLLCLPLKDQDGEIIGVLQLVNARDFENGEISSFGARIQSIVAALSSYAAVALHNHSLVQGHQELLDAFVRCIAEAIDAKSPHTSAHCARVPLLMELITEAANKDQTTFKDFRLTQDERHEIRMASWLHDCGKLATPDSVLDKSTKLHLVKEGIDEVETRIATMRQAAYTEYYKHLVSSNETNAELESALKNSLEQLESDRKFLLMANQGGETMSADDQRRVRTIAKKQWCDATGQSRPLLSEKEVNYLCIERGTLSNDERNIINGHMDVTLDILESLPFPKKLRRVPEIACGHHEKMDGTGFPRGLTGDQMSIPARMMAIADVFEALTASDRPYKPPMHLSQALSILKKMKDKNHIDPDLYDLFVRSRVWEVYGQKTLLQEQMDVTDIKPYL